MKRLTLFSIIFGLSIIIFSSCYKEEVPAIGLPENYIVQLHEAEQLAISYIKNKDTSQSLSLRENKWKGQSKSFFGNGNAPALHIFTTDLEENNSFVIISGDRRTTPILAHGESMFNFDDIPFGVQDWINQNVKFINELRINNAKQPQGVRKLWLALAPPGSDCCEECPNWPDCQDAGIGCGDETVDCNDGSSGDPCGSSSTTQYGPLLDTYWGQGCVYNQLCPTEGLVQVWTSLGFAYEPECDGNLPCDHFYTGCVATAMAQIINYFEHPNSYNYSSLQPKYYSWDFNKSGADEVARLMRDAGESVNMSYGCDGSGAYTSGVNDALEDDFGYAY